MTIAFVHGVPETADIWTALRAEMGEETVTLSKPGFGAPLPEGFDCTADGYLRWLIEEVSALPGPVDLIGHDWGGIHVVRLVMARPDLVRSWVSDVVGVFDPGYHWHDLAQAWQTPRAGEQAVAMMTAAPTSLKAAQLAAAHMPANVAEKVAEAMNAEMARAILPLYRSAAQPFLERIGEGIEAAATRPGLAIIATEDAYTGGAVPAQRMAGRIDAKVAVLEGESHWWMANQPKRGAEIIRAFLETLG